MFWFSCLSVFQTMETMQELSSAMKNVKPLSICSKEQQLKRKTLHVCCKTITLLPGKSFTALIVKLSSSFKIFAILQGLLTVPVALICQSLKFFAQTPICIMSNPSNGCQLLRLFIVVSVICVRQSGTMMALVLVNWAKLLLNLVTRFWGKACFAFSYLIR